jgi:hypothetical protein
MADDVNDSVERALACLVRVTERSGNLQNDLKKDIFEAVSSLRNYFVQVQTKTEAKTAAYKELERQVKESKDKIHRLRDTESSRTRHEVLPLDQTRNGYSGVRHVLPPGGNSRKLYSKAVKVEGTVDKRYELMVKSQTNHSSETIKNIIKTNINPTSMKVGICAFRSLWDGRVLLETKSK